MGFFTTGYNWPIQIIPALIVAPAFIRGDIEFGVITQSAAAFAMLVGAFSNCHAVPVDLQLRSGSRTAQFAGGKIEMTPAAPSTESTIEIVEREGALAYEQLTLLSSRQGLPLVKELSASIPPGNHVLLAGAGQAPATALFRATAGIPIPAQGASFVPAEAASFFFRNGHICRRVPCVNSSCVRKNQMPSQTTEFSTCCANLISRTL